MPTGENAGGIYVSIEADGSVAIAQFAKTEAAAKAAANSIGSSFASVTQVSQKAAYSISQVAASTQFLSATAAEATKYELGLTDAVYDAVAATTAESASTRQAASAQRDHATAMAGSTSQARLLGSELRVLSGQGGILAAERFLAGTVPAAFSSAIFPLFGAAAVIELVGKRFGGASEEEKKFAEETKRAAEQAKQATAEFDRLLASEASATIGKSAGASVGLFSQGTTLTEDTRALNDQTQHLYNLQANLAKTKAGIDALGGAWSVAGATASHVLGISGMEGDIKKQQMAVDALSDKVRNETEQQRLLREELSRIKEEQAGRAQGVAVSNRQAQLESVSKIESTEAEIEEGHARASVQSRIDAMKDRIAAGIATAQEEVRIAQQAESRITADLAAHIKQRIDLIRQLGAAEELGKTPEDIPAIRAATAGKVAELEATEGQKVLDAKKATAAAIDRLEIAVGTARRERASQQRESAIEDLRLSGEAEDRQIRLNAEKVKAAREEAIREQEISERSARETRSSATGISNANADAQKSRIELDYQLQIVHTRQQQIQYASDLAQIDTNRANRAIEDAAAEVATAQALLAQLPTAQALLDLQKAQTALAEAEAKAKQAELDSQKKIASVTQSTSISAAGQKQIQSSIQNLPGQISDDIGNSIAEALLGKHPGKSIGKEMAEVLTDSLRNTAKQALAGVISGFLKLGLGLLGFAGGGRPTPGVPAIVGENGPELFIPDVAGTVIPSVPKFSGGIASSLTNSMSVNSASQSISFGAIHIHGVRDMRDVARRLPDVLKAVSPHFSPARS